MAMIDYGSVVKKNGKIIQKDMFMDMKEAVGFTIDKTSHKYHYLDWDKTYKTGVEELQINDNYFSYMGDKDLLVCIYKNSVIIISNNQVIQKLQDLWLDTIEIPSYELQKNRV